MDLQVGEEVDADFVIRLRIVLSRLARQLNMTAASEGLSPTQAAIFTAIGRRGPTGLGRLAEAENVNPSMLSRAVAKLERAGLVERLPDPEDGRAYIVRHTDRGRAIHARLREEKTRWLKDRLRHLSSERIKRLLAALPALEDLAAILQDMEAPGVR